MRNYKFSLLLGVLLAIQALGLAGELVIEREKAPPKTDPTEWKKVEGTEMFIATFIVPPDFISRTAGEVEEDPFGERKRPNRKIGIKEILESVGIPFPGTATATYLPTRPEVIVRNTRENLELVQMYLDSSCIDPGPPTLAIRTEIYELTTLQALQLQESAEGEIDHKPERDAALRVVREGGARLVATHSTLTTPGQRTKLEDLVSLMVPEVVEEKGIEPHEKLAAYPYGTTLEAEPMLDADGVTISLNIALEHHTAEPELVTVAGKGELPKFHDKSVQTNIRLFSGGYLLLATWKPTGKPEHAEGDVTQVVFVTVTVTVSSQGGE